MHFWTAGENGVPPLCVKPEVLQMVLGRLGAAGVTSLKHACFAERGRARRKHLAVIPAILSFDLWDPRVGTKRFDATNLGGEFPPSLAGGLDDGVIVVMQPV